MLNQSHNIVILNEDAFVEPSLKLAIRLEVERVLLSDIFINTTRLKRFLTYVVEQTLSGNSDQLKGYNIGLDVFDRPENFNPSLNTNVRVSAMALRRRLNLFYRLHGEGELIKIHFEKGSYIPRFELHSYKDINLRNQETTSLSPVENVPNLHVSVFRVAPDLKSNDDLSNSLTTSILFALNVNKYIKTTSDLTSNDNSGKNPKPSNVTMASSASFTLQCELRHSNQRLSTTAHIISDVDGSYLQSKTFSYVPAVHINNEAIKFLGATIAAFACMSIYEVFAQLKITELQEKRTQSNSFTQQQNRKDVP